MNFKAFMQAIISKAKHQLNHAMEAPYSIPIIIIINHVQCTVYVICSCICSNFQLPLSSASIRTFGYALRRMCVPERCPSAKLTFIPLCPIAFEAT